MASIDPVVSKVMMTEEDEYKLSYDAKGKTCSQQLLNNTCKTQMGCFVSTKAVFLPLVCLFVTSL